MVDRVIELNSLNQLFATDLLEQIKNKFVGLKGVQRLWWRGQSDASLDLVPSVGRTAYTAANERGSVNEFIRKSRPRGVNLPPGPDQYLTGINGHVEWLTLMQHHGLPTRLLDWSESLLVGLFFVVSEKIHWDKDGALWALSHEKLNSKMANIPMPIDGSIKEVQDIAKFAFYHNTVPINKILALLPHQIDVRMAAQHTAFTLHGGDPPMKLNVEDSDAYLVRINIPASLKESIMNQLMLFAVCESTLFPDLSGLSATIRRRTFG